MAVRRSTWVLGVAGAVLIVLAPVMRYGLVPVVTKFPGNTDITFDYAGTATLMNAKALQTGDTAHVFETGVPITIHREIKATSTTGSTAIVDDIQALKAGATTMPSKHTFAIDRSNLEMAPTAGTTKVEKASGCLAISFPLGPKADSSYTFYDPSSQQCFPATYVNTTKLSGRTVQNYTIDAEGALKDPQLLASLPPALPKATLTSLAPLLPAATRAKLGPAVASLPDTVALTYLVSTKIKVAADKVTGFPLDEQLEEQVTAALTVNGASVPVTPVMDVKAAMTPASTQTLVHKATSTGRLLLVAKVVVPVALLVVGLVLLAVAFLRRRRHTDSGTTGQTTSQPRIPAAS